jgi:hypothetical protein
MLERSGIPSGYNLSAVCALAPWLADVLQLEKLPAMVSRTENFPRAEPSAVDTAKQA